MGPHFSPVASPSSFGRHNLVTVEGTWHRHVGFSTPGDEYSLDRRKRLDTEESKRSWSGSDILETNGRNDGRGLGEVGVGRKGIDLVKMGSIKVVFKNHNGFELLRENGSALRS